MPRLALFCGFIAPIACAAIAWIWCWIAWTVMPDASNSSHEIQVRTVFVASTLPGGVTTGLSIVSGIAAAIYLSAKRHGWLALVALLFQVPILFVIVVASLAFANFKPPGF